MKTDSYKNVMSIMGGNLKVPDRRKNKPLREVFDRLQDMFYQEMKTTCKCGRVVYAPRGLCISCSPKSEGGNYEA